MNLPDIKRADLENKRVLIRVDFNAEIINGRMGEKHRMVAAKQTVDFILSKPGVRVALLSHLGEGVSFEKFCGQIGTILKREVIFTNDCIGGKVSEGLGGLKDGQVLMLENVRFYKKEMENDADFAKQLAVNFDIYINEAFGVSHRDHASLIKILDFLPHFAGINLQREVFELEKIRSDFRRPAVAIIGGAKIETKLPVINFFAKEYEYILVGGKIGGEAQERKMIFPENVIIPADYTGGGLDIGEKTIEKFRSFIDSAKTIIWNGPLGKFESPEFARGTEEILDAVVKNKTAYKVVGGGETVQFLEEKGAIEKFNFVSTGGGAMLEFLAKGTLPVLEALKK